MDAQAIPAKPGPRRAAGLKKRLLRTVAPSVIVSAFWIGDASAACVPAAPANNATVSCTGIPNSILGIANSFLSNANDLKVTVQSGAIMSAPMGGVAMNLGGNGLTLTNLGAIDADTFGSQILARALAVGDLATPGSGTVVIDNRGRIEGMFDGTFVLHGAAMVVANAGTTTITNSGSIGLAALGMFDPINGIAVGIYGGGNVDFTNTGTGTITGRVALASPTSGGNRFVNAGTINGSVSLGTASDDTFVAVTGSSIDGGLTPLPGVTVPPAVAPSSLTFAGAGTVDAGSGGADTLVLQNTVAGPGSGTAGSGTVDALQYLNFERLTVNSGTWTLNGAVVSDSATLTGGVAIFDDALAFGTGTLTGNGGTIRASVAGMTLAHDVTLVGGLIVQGANSLTLGGNITGAGGMIKNGTGTLTLAGSNGFTGGFALNGGGLTLGTATSLGTNLFLVAAAATLNTSFTGTLANQVQLNSALTLNGSGTLTLGGNITGAGSLTLGSGNLSLAGSNGYSGGTTVQAGSIHVGTNNALGTGALTVNGAIGMTGAAGVTLGNNITLNNTLSFGTGGGALTLNGTISGAGGISLAGTPSLTLNGSNSFSGGFNLGGGSLVVGHNLALSTGAVTVSGAGSLDANAGVSLANNFNLNAGLSIGGSNNLALNGTISGTAAITKSGAANLTLGSANIFFGGLNLQGGGLTLGTSTSLGLGALTVNGAATLSTNAGIGIGNSVVLNAGLGIGGSNNITLGGMISGGGGLSFSGSGTLALNGANIFGNGVSLASGTLSAGNNSALGTGTLSTSGDADLRAGVPGVSLGNSIDLGSGTTLGLVGANSLSLNGTISGAGGLSIDSTASITLGGANNFAGDVELKAGNLRVGTSTSLGAGSLDVSGNASLSSTGVTLGLGNAISLGTGARLTIGGTANLSLSGAVAGHGALIKNGTGTLTLTGTDTHDGGTTINAGTLQVGNGGTTGSIAGNITNSATLVFDHGGSVTYGGTISGNGVLVKNGDGTLTLTAANDYTGNTTVNDGTLLVNDTLASLAVIVNNGGAVGGAGSIAGSVTVNSGGTLAAGNSPGTLTVGSLALGAGSTAKFDLNTPGTAGGLSNDLVKVTGNLTLGGTLEANAASAGYYRLFDYGGTLAGSFGTVNAAGFSVTRVSANIPGQINLSVLNAGQQLQFWDGADMSGNGTVNGGNGIWNAVNTNWTGAPGEAGINDQWRASVAVFQGTAGTVTVQGTQSFDTLQFNTTGYTLSGGTIAIGVAGGSTINVNGVDATIDSTIADGAGTALSVVGGGTLTLNGANSFTGVVTLNGATLNIGNSLALGSNGINITGSGGLQVATAGMTLANDITLGSGAKLRLGADAPILNGTISGAGGISFNGSGTLALNGANGFAGGTTLASGTLNLGNSGAIGTGALEVTGNSSLRAGVPGLALANSIDLGSGTTLGLGGANPIALDGAISGAGGLAITGGRITIGSANSFAGGVDLSGGDLVVGTGTSLGSGALDVSGNASLSSTGASLDLGNAINLAAGAGLTVDGAPDLGLGGAITGDGSLIKAGPGRLILTGENSYRGGTTINSGTLHVGNGGTSGSIGGDITNNGALTFNRAGSIAYGGTISGGGDLVKEGSGTLTLSGVNGYTGATTVNDGTLLVNGGLGNTTVAINDRGRLGGSGSIAGAVTVNNGGTLAAGNSPGTLTVGSLTLGAGSTSRFELNTPKVVGGPTNDLMNVTGDLTLGGTLEVAAGSAGYYRLFNYGGTLSGKFASIHVARFADSELSTEVTGEINLSVLGTGQLLQFWDGADISGNGTVDGGSGIWSATNTNWTGAPGQAGVNERWQDSVAVFQGAAGTVTVQGPLSFDTLQFNAGGYRLTGDALTIGVADGGTINVNGVGAVIDSAMIDGAGAALSVVGGGTLTLNGASGFTGGLTVDRATVVATRDVNLGAASGSIALDGGTLRFGSNFNLAATRAFTLDAGGGTIDTNGFATTVSQGITGAGGLTKAGGGTLTLAGTNSYDGSTIVSGGALLVHGSITSDTLVERAGMLGGNGTIVGDVTNAGTLSPGASIGRLTVDGNYTGNNGRLVIEAELGDDASPADRLVISGNARGRTTVSVVNTGGLGAQTRGDGIQIVDVGGTSARDAFTLAGPVQAGAFTYGLFLGGLADPNDQDWYLRSAGLRTATGVYPVLPSLMQDYGASLIGTLHQRMGDPEQANVSAAGSQSYFDGAWGRIIGQTGDRNPDGGSSYDFDLWGLQAGTDVIDTEHADGSRDRAGLYFAYGHSNATVEGARGGDASFNATAFGAYWTHFGAGGWYLDTVLQATHYQGRGSAGGTTIEPDGWGIAASLETGYPVVLGGGWVIEPQAQLIYQALDIDDAKDAASNVSFSDDESLRGRLGLRLVREWAISSGPAPRKASLAFTADIWGEALGDNKTTFTRLDGSNPLTFGSDLGGAWAEVGFETSVPVTEQISLYGGGRYATGFGGDRQAWSGQAGLRVNW